MIITSEFFLNFPYHTCINHYVDVAVFVYWFSLWEEKWEPEHMYGTIILLSHPIRQRRGGVYAVLDFITSLVIAIVGGVACHYIIKWLDGKGEDN